MDGPVGMEFLHGFVDVAPDTSTGIKREIACYLNDSENRGRAADILVFWKNRKD